MKLISFLFVLFLMVGQAEAITYYVNNSWSGASDTNNGTADTNASSWLTIGKCASTIAAGDTCLVKSGTYAETVTIGTSGTNATTAGRISYIGDNYPLVNITGKAFSAASKANITISGFNISSSDVGIYLVDSGENWNISNNIIKITGTPFNGITLNGGNYSAIINNTITATAIGIELDNNIYHHSINVSYNYVDMVTTSEQGRNAIDLGRDSSRHYNITAIHNTIASAGHNGLNADIRASYIAYNIINGSLGTNNHVYHNGYDFHGLEDSTVEYNVAKNCCDTNSGYYIEGVTHRSYNVTFRHNIADNITGGRGVTWTSNNDSYIQNLSVVNTTCVDGQCLLINDEASGIQASHNLTVDGYNSSDGIVFYGIVTLGDYYIINANLTDVIKFDSPPQPNITAHFININTQTTNWGTTTGGAEVFYYYLDVNVTDSLGNAISGATVTLTPNNSNYPALNTRPPQSLPIYNPPDNMSLTHTGSDGHTPLPSNRSWGVAIADYWRNKTDYTYVNYTLSVSANGYVTNSSVIVDADSTWYRSSPDTRQNTTRVILSPCTAIQVGNTIYNGNCTTISGINASLNNASVLNSTGTDEWLLNANLVINASTNFYIDNSDVSWLKLNSTYKTTATAYNIQILGNLYINNTKVTSWNTTTSDVENLPNLLDSTANGRTYIYTGTGAHLGIYDSNVSYLGGHCNNAFSGSSICNGITLATSNSHTIQNSTMIDNYFITIQQGSNNDTIENNTIVSKYAVLGLFSSYNNITNNRINATPQSSRNAGRFSNIYQTSTNAHHNNISDNLVYQLGANANVGAIKLESEGGNNTLINNTVDSTAYSALYLTGSSYNYIKGGKYTKTSPISAAQAPVQVELLTQNNNIFESVNITSSGSNRALLIGGNNTFVSNCTLINAFGTGLSVFQWKNGYYENMTIRNTTFTVAGTVKGFEHDNSGIAYLEDINNLTNIYITNNGQINAVNLSNIVQKIGTNASYQYPSNSTVIVKGNASGLSLTQYVNLSVFAANSTIVVNDGEGKNFTVTNNAGNVTAVNYSNNVTNTWIYYLNNLSATVDSDTAIGSKISFAGLSLNDGTHTIGNQSIAAPVVSPSSNVSSYVQSTCQSTLGWGQVGSALLIVLIIVMAGGLAIGFLTGTLKLDTFPIQEFVFALVGIVVIGSIGVAIINPIIIAVGCP